MKKVNVSDIPEESFVSPKGKYAVSFKGISEALGRDNSSLDLDKRHPFDLELNRIPPGKSMCPYHAHSAQWEFYLVVSGIGQVRHEGGTTEVVAGDAFIFRPTEAHALSNVGETDFVYYVVADNPVGDCCYYPDSSKVSFRKLDGSRDLYHGTKADYHDGEE